MLALHAIERIYMPHLNEVTSSANGDGGSSSSNGGGSAGPTMLLLQMVLAAAKITIHLAKRCPAAAANQALAWHKRCTGAWAVGCWFRSVLVMYNEY
jgi:hypothetical protein